jgi:predicted O-linked N-acetylglucosamine transferase (SPINDLY family)
MQVMATISEALAIAIQHHQAGRLEAAEQIYRLILQAEPNRADVVHLRGMIAHQLGNHELAVEYIGRAIGLDGNVAAFHNNLGGAYYALHRLPEAIACYRRAVELKPDLAEAHNNLGNACKDQGKLDEAVACCRRAVELKPDYAKAHYSLGNVFSIQGKLDEATACYRCAVDLKPDYVEAHYNLGNAFNVQGKLDAAAACWRRALELKPDYADAHYNLGNVSNVQGNLDEAVACYRRAVELKPDYADAHSNLGKAFRDQGKLDEAVACCRRAVELKPDHAEAYSNLGVAFKDQGNLDEAVACFRRALELKPDFAEAHNNLGVVLAEQGKQGEAAVCWRRALELKPDYAAAYTNLGNAMKAQGKLDEAVGCFCRAVELKPGYAEIHVDLGNAFDEQGKLDEAVGCYRRAVELKPEYAEARSNLGNALREQGKLDEAVACFRRALELKPDCAEVYSNLGAAFGEQGKLDEAVACFRRASELKPDFAEARNNLGNALKDEGNLDEAVACFHRALELKPDYIKAHSNLLLTLQYRTGVSPAALADAHAEFDRRHAAPLGSAVVQHENVRDRHRRLRLGFVSPDLGRHPVGFFLVRILENLSHEQQETICYSDRVVKDGLTHRLQAVASQWRDVTGISDQRLAEQIRADRIDILFDLAGHTAHNRLLTFARKPAPIQITWLGYVGTTGLRAMDYILADRHLIPAEAEPYYCEKVLRMPEDYACYNPPSEAPAPGSLPAMERGHVTFGSFNNLCKITPQVIEVWSGILHRVSKSRLVIRYRGLDDPGMRQRFIGLFADQGIAGDRVDLLGWSPFATRMELYQQIDIGLDPFPYSGATTTCDALWMGVPVITCPGETFASRQSLTHILAVGLEELVARDLADYIERAVELATDQSRLVGMRAGLRERMAASPLCDGKRFATNLMSILHDVWERWLG